MLLKINSKSTLRIDLTSLDSEDEHGYTQMEETNTNLHLNDIKIAFKWKKQIQNFIIHSAQIISLF